MVKKIIYTFLCCIGLVLFVVSIYLSSAPRPSTPSLMVDGVMAVSIGVASSTYRVTVPKNTNIYVAMTILASSTTLFRFKATLYSELGYYIEEINGIKNDNGKYWTLYVNDSYSNVGVSRHILKPDDQIEWKLK